MNAPLPPDAVAVASLPVAEIVPSPSNPRKHFDDAYIAELAESIKVHGLIQPITVRPLPLDAMLEYNKRRKKGDDSAPRYEIVVGECRWRAAQQAGLTEIPGFWRELDDKQVLELQVIENLQRRDVHEIEEAEGYEALMKRHGYTADEIAAKIGKSRGYVYARLKLTALCKEARTAFFDGKLDASTALLVARIPGATLQKRAVKEVTCGYDGEPLSYRNAKNHIQHHFTISLKQATFPLDDAALVPAAGSGADCPKRSGNTPELCADLKDEDVCTDTTCFEDKRLTRRQQLLDNAEKKGIQIFIGEKAREIAPYGLHSLDEEQYINLDAIVEGDAQERTYRDLLGDKTPVAALLETGHGPRLQIIELGEPTVLAKALRKAGWQPDLLKTTEEQQAARQSIEQRESAAAERKAKEEAAKAEGEYRKALAGSVIDRMRAMLADGTLTAGSLIPLFATAWLRFDFSFNEEVDAGRLERFGIQVPIDQDASDDYDDRDQLEKACKLMANWSVDTAAGFLFDVMTSEETNTNIWNFDPERDQPHTLLTLAKLVDFTPETLREPASTPTTAAQAPVDATAAAPAEAKGKKGGAKKTKAKTDPAPASPANEPPAAAETPAAGLGDWPFPTRKETA